jgi:tetratricopeptide (TPR) repeat protein
MHARFCLPNGLIELGNHGMFAEGLAVAQQSLAQSRHSGNDQQQVLQHLLEVSEFLFQLERYEEAVDVIQESLARHALLAENQPSFWQVEDLNCLGYYYLCSSRLDLAEDCLQRGLTMIEQLPENERLAFPSLWLNLSHVARRRRDYALAKRRLMTAWKVFARYTPGTGCMDLVLLHNHAWNLAHCGQWQEAERICRIALKAYDQPNLPSRNFVALSCVHSVRSLIHEHEGQHDLAVTDISCALDLLRRASWHPAARRSEMSFCERTLARLTANTASAQVE